MAHQKPRNVERDSMSYSLPHEVGFLIQALADQEARELDLPNLSTSDYLARLIRREAAGKLSEEQREQARLHHEQRKRERLQRATQPVASS
jgi:hypothetical protein